MTGDDQQYDHSEDLLLGKGVALVSGGEQRADEIISGCGPPCREQLPEIGDERAHLLEETFEGLLTDRGRHDCIRPQAKAVSIR